MTEQTSLVSKAVEITNRFRSIDESTDSHMKRHMLPSLFEHLLLIGETAALLGGYERMAQAYKLIVSHGGDGRVLKEVWASVGPWAEADMRLRRVRGGGRHDPYDMKAKQQSTCGPRS